MMSSYPKMLIFGRIWLLTYSIYMTKSRGAKCRKDTNPMKPHTALLFERQRYKEALNDIKCRVLENGYFAHFFTSCQTELNNTKHTNHNFWSAETTFTRCKRICTWIRFGSWTDRLRRKKQWDNSYPSASWNAWNIGLYCNNRRYGNTYGNC